jgi:hypothetical protein
MHYDGAATGLSWRCSASVREEEVVGRKLHDTIHHLESEMDRIHPIDACPIYLCARRTESPRTNADRAIYTGLDGSALPDRVLGGPTRS